ncbi:MAG: App1 family protein [Deltaproteobacteria bacterium]|nr:App1 family protein [Deltaproteobacteria bacterium]
MRARSLMALAAGWTLLAGASVEAKSPIKSDEEVVFFPTSAYWTEGMWIIPVHGWIFEPEMDSSWRAKLTASLGSALEDQPGTDRAIFERRLRWFLVDNERGKQIPIRLAGERVRSAASESNGHFHRAIRTKSLAPPVKEGEKPPLIEFLAETREGDRRRFAGQVQLVPPEGVTVVSDIDDTIKITEVLDRRSLIRHTFYLPFEAVTGMAEAYSSWASRGAAFAYLSASPWQLYPELGDFMKDAGFPWGTLRLRYFRLKDRTLVSFLSSSKDYKTDSIERLMKCYPKRRFILVGDSGEKDPEVYGAVARKHPERILHVFIRKVPKSDLGQERMARAFEGLDAGRWTLFDDPAVLSKFSLAGH